MSTPSTADLLGGRYELLEPIGHGGMSTVYRALDRALGRPVAVKVIRHESTSPEDRAHLRERFRREAAHAAHIPPHPNVVQIYDYGSDPTGDRDFLVMELLRGKDLKTVQRERRISTAEAVGILREAARGLAAGHRAGIVHRDVKPANLMVPEEGHEGTVRVLDFGIAKALEGDPDDDLTHAGRVPHTPAYASPEQRAGWTLGPASDVYQLGLVAYELLTGERPFDADQRDRLAGADGVPLPSRGSWERLPAPLRAVVERALRPDPAERYPDAGAFAAAVVEAWEGNETIVAPPADDGTVAAPAPGDATAVLALRAPEPGGARRVAADRARLPVLGRGARLALAGALGALLLWGVLRGTDGRSTDGTGGATPPSAEELEEDFAPLYRDAAERLADRP